MAKLSALPVASSVGTSDLIYIVQGGVDKAATAAQMVALVTSLPPQTGFAGKFLTTDGTSATWAAVIAGVTSVSNSDGTLTISPTGGAVVASLALGHPNTWTATQTGTWAGVGSALTSLTAANISPGTAGISITGNAATVTNGVVTTGSYASPAWITSIAAGILTGTISGTQMPALTGAVTMTAGTTSTTISALAVTNAMLAGSIAASKLVGTDITTVGVITSGTWIGTAIAIANGGTGQATAVNALTALLPSQTSNAGKVLGTNGTVAAWVSLPVTAPPGDNFQVPYNNDGAWAASPLMVFRPRGNLLTLRSGFSSDVPLTINGRVGQNALVVGVGDSSFAGNVSVSGVATVTGSVNANSGVNVVYDQNGGSQTASSMFYAQQFRSQGWLLGIQSQYTNLGGIYTPLSGLYFHSDATSISGLYVCSSAPYLQFNWSGYNSNNPNALTYSYNAGFLADGGFWVNPTYQLYYITTNAFSMLRATCNTPAMAGLTLTAASGQTAPLVQILNNLGVITESHDAKGNATFVGAITTSGINLSGTAYIGTTSGNPVSFSLPVKVAGNNADVAITVNGLSSGPNLQNWYAGSTLVASLTPGGTLTAQQILVPSTTLTDVPSGTISWNLTNQSNATVTLTTGVSRKLGNPSNPAEGGFYSVVVIQGTGSDLLTYDTLYDFGTFGTPVLTTTVGYGDILNFRYTTINGTAKMRGVFAGGYH